MKDEFCKKRGLKPVKIFITGPPASGKSFYGKQLADHYNVPHIHLQQMLHEIENWNKEKEEGIFKRREVKARIRAHEEALKEEERKKQEAALNTSQARPGTSSTAQNPDTSLAMTDGGEAPAEKVDEKPVPDEEKPDTDSDDEY